MSKSIFNSPRSLYKAFALSEGVTWALLLGGLAFRAAFGAPQLLLTVIGGIHGAVFLGVRSFGSVGGGKQPMGFRQNRFGNCAVHHSFCNRAV